MKQGKHSQTPQSKPLYSPTTFLLLPVMNYLHCPPHLWGFHWRFTYTIITTAERKLSLTHNIWMMAWIWKKRIPVKHRCYRSTSKNRKRRENIHNLFLSWYIFQSYFSMYNLKRKFYHHMLITKYSWHQPEKEKSKTPGNKNSKLQPNWTLTTYNISTEDSPPPSS